jgi:hypothetical protein
MKCRGWESGATGSKMYGGHAQELSRVYAEGMRILGVCIDYRFPRVVREGGRLEKGGAPIAIPFGCNPPRSVFDPYARQESDGTARAKGESRADRARGEGK